MSASPEQKRVRIAIIRLRFSFILMPETCDPTAQRQKEFDDAAAGVENILGKERMKEMIRVYILACHPDHQRRGYGTALVKTITYLVRSYFDVRLRGAKLQSLLTFERRSSKADADDRETWLLSSNIANVTFYSRFGFEKVAEVVLGANNPTYDGPPVRLPLVCKTAAL